MSESGGGAIYGGAAHGGRSWPQALWRGARKRCPQCDGHGLFVGYLTTAKTCPHCALALDGHRADDAPPYITIMIVGHLLIPAALATKQLFDPPLALQFLIWGPALVAASAWLLPIAKGAMIGLQWANRMHGFGEEPVSA